MTLTTNLRRFQVKFDFTSEMNKGLQDKPVHSLARRVISKYFPKSEFVDIEVSMVEDVNVGLKTAHSMQTTHPSSTQQQTGIPHSKLLKTLEERQLINKKGIFAWESEKCRYGYPRAIVRYPVAGDKMNSGMLRLTCPHLVKALDTFEYSKRHQGVARMNALLMNRPDRSRSEDAQANESEADASSMNSTSSLAEKVRDVRTFYHINKAWTQIRLDLMTEEDQSKAAKHLTSESEMKAFLQSGIIGINYTALKDFIETNISESRVSETPETPETPRESQVSFQGPLDVKCLHAHVADAFLRGKEKNPIGALALEELKGRMGVDSSGCSDCWQQCNTDFQPTETSWRYVPARNKFKLHKRQFQEKLKSID